MRKLSLAVVVVTMWMAVVTSRAALDFDPAPGYAAVEVWSGSNASHFAIAGDTLYVLGAEPAGGGQLQSVVWQVDGGSSTEIARSAPHAPDAYFPDAISVVDGDVYWVHAQAFSAGGAANLYKTTYDGNTWSTSTIVDEAAGTNLYSLSTNGTRLFGVGYVDGTNSALYLDDAEQLAVLASLPADGSGGSGFDPAGNLFAGAWSVGGDFASHMYKFDAQQIADRVAGAQAAPYTAGAADTHYVVPNNATAVMESDGLALFGADYNATWSGTNPFAYDLTTGATTALGTLGGADTAVTTDLYARGGAVYFMGKNAWGVGSEAVIYELVPEPAALLLLAVGGAVVRRRGN